MRIIVIIGLLVAAVAAADEKITGGYECPPHSQPWQVYLTARDGSRWCGSASLINSQWAVGSAICYLAPPDLVVHMGEHHLFQEEGTEQRVFATKVIRHPEFNTQAYYDNDIMLIKLGNEAVFNKFVQPIGLPTTCAVEGEECLVSGWGQTSTGTFSSVLQCVNMPVVSRAKCQTYFGSAITDNMFCAGGLEGKACHGDAGNPMVCKGKLQGIVTWGYSCPDSRPGVYTEICRYINWINTVIANN